MGGQVIMFKKNDSKKIKIMFVDETNDLQSQIAEFFLHEFYSDMYEEYSAGPKMDYIDCELISVMYQEGYDIRSERSKDFRDKTIPGKLDYIVFLEGTTYDRIKDVIPWDSPQILMDFGRKSNFVGVTDDAELAESYTKLINNVKDWIKETFKDPATLDSMVI
jgi:protein-tyrosine-phosphatase